jgi:hypothetical protein
VVDDIAKTGECNVAIDMTGFTREALAMLMFLCEQRLAGGSKITCFYHKAERYGQDQHKGWLSQGVREVRSVVGYPGKVRIAGSTDLILIAGFETERAQEIIDTIQPNQIILGELKCSPDALDAHDDTLSALTSRLAGLYSGTNICRFDFWKNDPFATCESILKVAESSVSNVVVASLNSKPAMLGACLAALRNDAIQLVYAQPQCYNITQYSEPSGTITFFEYNI